MEKKKFITEDRNKSYTDEVQVLANLHSANEISKWKEISKVKSDSVFILLFCWFCSEVVPL